MATIEAGDGDGGGDDGLKTGSVAVWSLFGLVFGQIGLGWVASCRSACLSLISSYGLPVGVGWLWGHG